MTGATHLVVHLGRLTGDDTAVVAILAGACQRLWLQQGIMETIGMRDRHVSVPPPREAPEVVEEEGREVLDRL